MRRPLLILTLIAVLIAGWVAAGVRRKTAPNDAQTGRNGEFPAAFANRVSQSHEPNPALDDLIFYEDFEAIVPGGLPANWSSRDIDGGYSSWFGVPSTWFAYSRNGFSAFSGTRFLMCPFNDDALPNNDWLILPEMQIGAPIQFSFRTASQDPGFLESLELRLSTTGVNPEDFTTLLLDIDAVPAGWTLHVLDLSEYADSPFRLAFRCTSVNRFALKIDDVALLGTPPPSGALSGYVTGSQSEPIIGANINVLASGRMTWTDSSGFYYIDQLPEGAYSVAYSHPYYYSHFETDVVITDGQITSRNMTLDPRELNFYNYTSTSSPRQITDFDTAGLRIDIPDTVIIYDIDVTVSLDHSFIGDLSFWLQTADTEFVQLVQADDLNDGQNIVNCRFDDQAPLPFSAGHPPYTGRFRPLQPLNTLVGDTTIAIRGTNPRGNRWFIRVYDGSADDVGTLYGFSLHIAENTLDSDFPEPTAPAPRLLTFAGNYPNPFNASTQFRFDLARTAPVSLILYNSLGQEVATVLNQSLAAGTHSVSFEAAGIASGTYFARLSVPEQSLTQRIVLLK